MLDALERHSGICINFAETDEEIKVKIFINPIHTDIKYTDTEGNDLVEYKFQRWNYKSDLDFIIMKHQKTLIFQEANDTKIRIMIIKNSIVKHILRELIKKYNITKLETEYQHIQKDIKEEILKILYDSD